MSERYDAIVVGAGPAGCAAAYDLAAAGASVLLIDRARFPRVKPCAGGLTIKTLRLLRYSVAPAVRQVCTDLVLGKRLERTTQFGGRHPICALTVRSEFDAFCLERTRAQGAEFRVIRHIDALIEHSGEVVLETTAGTLHARYLIGADGANSVIRRFLGAAPLMRGFAIEGMVRTAVPAPMTFDFGVAPHGYGWVFPKRDHANVGLFTSSVARPGRPELEAYARARLGAVIVEHIVGHYVGTGGWLGAPARRPVGSAPECNRPEAARPALQAPARARVALVGDAAGLTEPLLGEGIHNAIASGQAAAAAVLDSQRTDGDLAAAYLPRLRPILADLTACARTAAHFYQHLDIGYRALTLPFVAAGLLKAYASGMTFSAAQRKFALLPIRAVQPVRW